MQPFNSFLARRWRSRTAFASAWLLSVAMLSSTAWSAAGPAPGTLFLVPDIVHFGDGTAMTAERGYFFVQENRAKKDSKTIAIAVMRFATTAKNPQAPVFVLAGGPGSSYIMALKGNDNRYFEPSTLRLLIEDLRQVGDVVLPDQRGAGLSLPFLNATERPPIGGLDAPLTERRLTRYHRDVARAAKAEWEQRGRDVDGYSALSLAADVNELRQALGYDAISLYGGSFGSESSFTILREYPEIVSRVALWGIEDIDHTFDMPSGILESLRQIIADAEADPEIAPLVPEGGILAAVQRTIDALKASPVTVDVEDPQTGEPVQVVIGAGEFQSVWAQGARRQGPQEWPGNLLPALGGDYQGLALAILELKQSSGDSPRFPRAQFQAIDCGLPPSRERRKALKRDPAIGTLGDINLAYWSACKVWQAPEVSEAFKEPLSTEIPALFLHGTHDTSTPLMNAKAAIAGYDNGHLVVVERATHGVASELYRERPDFIRPLLRRFLRGESIEGTPDRITLPPADYVVPKQGG